METKELIISTKKGISTFTIIPHEHYKILQIKNDWNPKLSQYFHNSSMTEIDIYRSTIEYPCSISLGSIGFQKNIFIGSQQSDCDQVAHFLFKHFM